jgi:hypothetical protein
MREVSLMIMMRRIRSQGELEISKGKLEKKNFVVDILLRKLLRVMKKLMLMMVRRLRKRRSQRKIL